MSERGTAQRIAEELALAVQPLREAFADLESFQMLLLRLGWEAESVPPAYADLSTRAAEALAAASELGDGADPHEVADALERSRALYVAIRGLDEAPAGVDPAAFLAEFSGRLYELLLVDYLTSRAASVANVLRLLDVIQVEDHEATPTRPGFVRARFRADEIPRVVTDPGSIPARAYGWGTQELDFVLVANHLFRILHGLGFPAVLEEIDPELGPAFQVAPEETDDAISTVLRIPICDVDVADTTVQAALGLLELPGENGQLPGMILQPLVPPEVGTELDLGADLQLRVRAGSDLAATFGIVIRPGEIAVRYPFQPGTEPPAGGFGLALAFAPAEPRLLLGEPESTRLQIGGVTTGVDLDVEAGELELRASLVLTNLLLAVSAGDQDGFLSDLLGGDLTVPLPLQVHWSSRTGLTFSGSTGFAVSTYPRLSVGPIRVDELALAVRAIVEEGRDPELAVGAGLGLSGTLGPIGFVVEGIGLRLRIVLADGNAGPFDLGVGFQPPDGMGLVVDAGPVTGGGFLSFDHEQGRYAGVLQLDVYGIAVKAIGLLDTRLPSGGASFSFLIVVSAEFEPVQLGLGFTLNGVGGLAGVHRTVAVDALQAGLRGGTIDRILFPEDPVRDANQLVSDLRTIFPPARGRFVFGPVALIGWGTPTVVEAEVALVLDLPAPVRLILLGQVSAALPTKAAPIVDLHVDVVGVMDFAKRTLGIDAALHDSRIAGFNASGDMAVRLSWGADPSFALAVGGLNPHFQPPPGFPTLQRLTIALGTGDNPRLGLQAYLALTSNTVQVGARAEIYAAAAGFNIYGWLGFDALFVLSPFSFVADLTGGVALRRGTSVIAGVTLDATLTGPAPWHAVGRASLSLLFFSVTVPFDATFGEGRSIELPPADPRPLLVAAVEDPRNWATTLPSGTARLASGAAGLIDPVGGLTLRQTVVPLNRRLTRFGAAVPVGPDRYDIDGVTIGPRAVSADPVTDLFAAAQFEAMTDAEKLSRPSFERMDAGVSVADAADCGTPVGTKVAYETIIVDTRFTRRRGPRYTPTRVAQLAALERAATARSTPRRSGFERFAPDPGAPLRVALADDRFVVVSTDDLGVREDVSAPAGKGAASLALAAHLAAHPDEAGRLQVVPVTELA